MSDTDFLSMSDEDFLNDGLSQVNAEEAPSGVDESEPVEEEVQEQLDESKFDDEPTDEGTDADDEEQQEEVEESDEQEESDSAEEVPEDFSRILKPFRANGKDISVKSVDEALSLMQMGANYTKKMQALQPTLKMVKSLEKNQLLDEDKLNYLIDLSNKDPKAIARLVKEADYDPMSLDDEEVEYTPTNHQVSEQSMKLDTVLESIESTPTYDKCIDVVGNQWDKVSQQLLTQEPNLIAELNEQMSVGIFDKITAEVERAKMFGGLSGLSDFEAYRTVGAQMHKAGGLEAPQAQPVARTQVKPNDATRSLKRRAAATPKTARKTTKAVTNDYLNMSDEEFLKINNINI